VRCTALHKAAVFWGREGRLGSLNRAETTRKSPAKKQLQRRGRDSNPRWTERPTTVLRPRRNDRNAASQLEPASGGNAGGNESQPAVWATPYRQCRRPEDVQLLARVPSRPAACACSEPHCAPPMGKPASGAQQAGLSVLVSCGANCASLRVPQARDCESDEFRAPLCRELRRCLCTASAPPSGMALLLVVQPTSADAPRPGSCSCL
jgi:hypothetical protein